MNQIIEYLDLRLENRFAKQRCEMGKGIKKYKEYRAHEFVELFYSTTSKSENKNSAGE